ncbi:hypothetical protein BOC43_26970 [Burkholderia pseudomallei]|nr:hypothetical protein BOC43_26970 [Burkholderia pseudomallei]
MPRVMAAGGRGKAAQAHDDAMERSPGMGLARHGGRSAANRARAARRPRTAMVRRAMSVRVGRPRPHSTGFFLVHRRKPWSLGERLRNLTPDFMDVRRRNCLIARHFRH